MKWFSNLLSSDPNSPSSKRYIALVGFFTILIIVLTNLFFKLTIAEFLFYGLLGLVAACLGLNTISTNKAMSVNSQVASDIAKNNTGGTAAGKAQDIIKSATSADKKDKSNDTPSEEEEQG